MTDQKPNPLERRDRVSQRHEPNETPKGKLSILMVDGDGMKDPDYGLYLVKDASKPAHGHNIKLLRQGKRTECEAIKREYLAVVAALR